ncbi:hypothetical protein J2W15_003596 [Pseudarthrobacter sulfonivorans]|nr:hypothetical protein [Pseudarthrobacter sulfonivorans]
MSDTDKPDGRTEAAQPAAQSPRATRRSPKTEAAQPAAQPTRTTRRSMKTDAAGTAEGGEPTRTSAELAELERLRARLVTKFHGRR